MGRKKILTREHALDVLNRWFVENSLPPTVEEFRGALGVPCSIRTAFRYLKWLEEEKDIERWPGARGLRTVRKPEVGVETQAVPIVGTAPAGALMAAEENLEGWVKLPKEFMRVPGAKHFLLRVKGDSMDRCRVGSETIENADLVLVRQQAVAHPGDVVVALIDGEATIKKLVRGPGYYVLEPQSSNPNNKPIPVVVDQDFRVQGVVVKVLKDGSKLLH